MEAEARPGARRLYMGCLQSHWCPQQQWMQMVSHTLLSVALPCSPDATVLRNEALDPVLRV